MLRNYFSFIAAYKRISSHKELKRLDPNMEYWLVVKKRSWLPHKAQWLTTVYRGILEEVEKGKVTSMVTGGTEVYKGCEGDGPLELAERGLPGSVTELLAHDHTYVFLWNPAHALQVGADRPVFTKKTLHLICRYLW